ncbi:MAG: carbohydrate binding family 9 domain-containing protein [Flavobacteriaceae bacterium]
MIINKMRVVFLCLGLIFTLGVFAQTSEIKFLNTEVSIDGDLKEKVWQELQESTGFYNHMPTDIGLAKNQTSVKIFHNGEYLYIGAIYNDSISRRQVSSLKRDVSIGISDAFVVVLDTQNQQQTGNLFAVNSYGTQVDALVERVNTGYGLNFSWSTVWKARATVKGTQKIYEIAIPLKALNFNENATEFGIQFYVRDIKNNSWTILENVKRNYLTFDLRFTRKFAVENLPSKVASRFAITPSLSLNYQNDVEEKSKDLSVKPSLDVQYNVTSSLKLDATINPDFSQIDVDQQVTNLTRFSIFFPERRNFFLENADLFSNLGTSEVNPFYSRRVGANSDIQFGVKLSGNLTPKTRIGILNVQTGSDNAIASENFGALVAEQQLTKNFTATGFLINRQETDKFRFIHDYNRVTGVNLNYKSDNNKWIGLANYGKSFNDNIIGDNNFFNLGVWFNTRELSWNASIKKVEKNYITDVGFTPRLYNYDAINDIVIREGYTETEAGIQYRKFYDQSKTINRVRYINYVNNNYYDEEGKLSQSSHFLNSAVFFKDLSAIYYVFEYDMIDLKYGFDPLGNENSLNPEKYHFGIIKVGYNSANNQKFRYRANIQKGTYYSGKRSAAGVYFNYQLLPFANLSASYDINSIDLNELGKETFHLTRFTGEVFFNTRLNWTTYVQHNTQRDVFNINSRLQWEYKPLSYVYFVVTDNFNKNINRKNWGVSFKINYRFDL